MNHALRVCRFEQMEPRRLLAVDIATIQVGAVYFEDAIGLDAAGDLFEVTWTGGAPGTQLTELVINTDKREDGQLSDGDPFFDLDPTGEGASGAVELKIDAARTSGIDVDSIEIELSDGGTRLVMRFTDFDPGDRLVFSVDVDEAGFPDSNPVVEGKEFEGSHLVATFEAAHFFSATGEDMFLDDYNGKLDSSGLDLPPDAYTEPIENPRPDQTAAAVIALDQTPLPITIAGTVFEDIDLNNVQGDTEPGIEGVELALLELVGDSYEATGQTTTTDPHGNYLFVGVLPGTYQIAETQPDGYFSIGATAGTVDGQTRGAVVDPDTIGNLALLGGEDSVDNDFAEALPAVLSGHVYHDADNDGVMDPGEQGIADVAVYVEQIPVGGLWLPSIMTTQTAADGSWQVDNLMPGDYRVMEEQPEGYFDGLDAAGTAGGTAQNPGDLIDAVHLDSGQVGQEYNFGELLPASIAGRVLADRNANCVYDPGELLLSGVTVYLLDASGARIQETTTDEQGVYAFTDLLPGVYGVEEIQPDGYFDGRDHAGSAGGALLAPDSIVEVALTSGTAGVGYDFCEIPPGSLAGHVYADDNVNGTFDPGERPLADVTVELLDESGAVVRTTQTNAAGEYLFANLRRGIYTVHELQPEGYLDGQEAVGSIGGSLLPPDSIVDIDLRPGVDAVDYDFGEVTPASIAGRVWADFNRDQILDEGEPLLAGVTIHLLDASGAVLKTTETDADGDYLFAGLLPGTYGAREVQPAGYKDGPDLIGSIGGSLLPTDSIVDIALSAGVDAVQYDFTEILPASLAGHVYADDNVNGTFDPGEMPLEGVTVELLDESGAVVQTTQTNAAGEYLFANLRRGIYTVHEFQPEGYFDGQETVGSIGGALLPPDSIADIDLQPGVDAVDYDFGEVAPASIAGRVWADFNRDQVLDEGEPLLDGVTIHLLDASGAVLETTETDADGAYLFAGLLPGTYGAGEVQPAGYKDGPDLIGSIGGSLLPTDSIVDIVLSAGVDAVRYDFTENLPASLSGHVYVDDNDNGLFEADETGLAGVTVTLLDADGSPTDRTTTTDAAGFYRFEDLKPGTYGVAETQPQGYFDGKDTAGSVGGNVDSPTDRITRVVLKPGVDAFDYDFGELGPASISGRVHAELTGNCIPDPGEPLLAGVTIYLLDASGERIASTTTDQQGMYYFTNLRPGVYGVEEVQPEDYLQGRTHPGSEGGRLISEDRIVDASLGSGVVAVDYNFCEKVPARISGYVFQDGPTIKLMPDEEAPDPASVRDGRFTSDDTPIAGVLLKLGDGSGAPILDAVGEPITTTTDSRGYYEFTGLQPGVYTILEVQPEGFVDSIDTAGSHGGIAVNPSDDIDPMVLMQLAVDPNDDAIIRIPLGTGDRASSYNFSEVLIEETPSTIIIPTPDPQPMPRQPDVVPGSIELPPVLYFPLPPEVVSNPIFGGAGGFGAYTWHLSVINAGRPRRDRPTIQPIGYGTSTYFDPVSWTGGDLGQSLWIITDTDGTVSRKAQFGLPDGIPVTGDFNGDGIDEIGVYVSGNWFLDLNGNGVWDAEDLWAKLGAGSDRPVTGDWDGDGKTDIGVFGPAWMGDSRAILAEPGLPDADNRPTERAKNLPPDPDEAALRPRTMKPGSDNRMRSDLIDHVFRYGQKTDRPISGDFNGDGIATIGVFRDGTWLLDMDGNGRWSKGDVAAEFGQEGDIPVVGDFNGDGIDDLGVYRAGTWYLDTNGDRALDARDKVLELGGPDDQPVVGDFNGDGIDEIAVYQDQAPPPQQQAAQ